jgi:hypothetical protein
MTSYTMTPQPQPHNEAARYLKGFDFSGPFAHSSIGSDWPDSEKHHAAPGSSISRTR